MEETRPCLFFLATALLDPLASMLNPPLSTLPPGKWYCPRCEFFLKKKKNSRSTSNHDDVETKRKKRRKDSTNNEASHMKHIERTTIRIGEEYQATIPSFSETRRENVELEETKIFGGVIRIAKKS